MKLLSFFEGKYGTGQDESREGENGNGNMNGYGEGNTVVFSTERAEEVSEKLRDRIDFIKNGYVEGFLRGWRGKWEFKR